jgi:hypothetical protein
MKTRTLIPAVIVLLLIVFACHKNRYKDFSAEGKPYPSATDTLPADYPFTTGLCLNGGASLGIYIPDNNFFTSSSAESLPESLILDMPAPGDQGSQGSCSAWATAYALGTYYSHLATGKPYSDTGNLSPKYTYNQITKGNCTCTSLLDNIYLMKTQGVSSLNKMPYDAKECSLQPNATQITDAVAYKITDWRKLNPTDTALIKRALLEKKPVAFGIGVDDTFKKIKAPYIWKDWTSAGEGHAMVIVGYNNSKKAFRVMNSWSNRWADHGFVWIDYDLFAEHAMDACYVVL